MPAAEVHIEGLAELRRGLKAIDAQLVKDLRKEFLPIAALVAEAARAKVPQRTGEAAASIRGGVSGNYAYVSGGKKSVPYYGWLDFGSRTPRTGARGPWKGTGAGPPRGRFIYPAVDANLSTIERLAGEGIQAICDKAFP